MSKRDQNLLLLMAIVAIVFGGYKLLIVPGMAKTDELQAYYDEISMEVTMTKGLIANLPNIQIEHDEKVEKLQVSNDLIDEYQEDEEVGREFIALSETHETTLKSFTLSHSYPLKAGTTTTEKSEILIAKDFSIGIDVTYTEFANYLETFQQSTDSVFTSVTYNASADRTNQNADAQDIVTGVTFTIVGQTYMNLPEIIEEEIAEETD